MRYDYVIGMDVGKYFHPDLPAESGVMCKFSPCCSKPTWTASKVTERKQRAPPTSPGR